MAKLDVAVEEMWLLSLPISERMYFLFALSHALTLVGRESYIPQTLGLSEPPLLRLVNEIQHRLAACGCELMKEKASESFQRAIVQMVLTEPPPTYLNSLIYAWNSAKARIELQL